MPMSQHPELVNLLPYMAKKRIGKYNEIWYFEMGKVSWAQDPGRPETITESLQVTEEGRRGRSEKEM